jgi:CRISPR/Cas system-associated exonuclease Cas4 (RecB family)
MSYSSLRELEECPRRWALRRATYPEIWDRPGYPDLPSLPSLIGDVVHLSLEKTLRALVVRGCDSPRSACAVAVLRELGGYSAIVESAIQSKLEGLESNPRVRDRLPLYRSALSLKSPELRRRVQEVVTRSALSPRASAEQTGDGRGTRALLLGSFTELEVRAETLRWVGRVDLLSLTPTTCEIIDYKTGSEHEDHATQLRTYALLWLRDTVLNPFARVATRLVIAYPTHDVVVDVPTSEEVARLDTDLRSRTEAARQATQERPPQARPAADICSACSVRQVCVEYWRYLSSRDDLAPSVFEQPTFGDVEVIVNSRQGPKSWKVSVTRGVSTPESVGGRLRTQDESAALSPGSCVRLLGVLIAWDEESELVLLTMTPSTEVFQLAAGG